MLLVMAAGVASQAEPKYDVGASDTEIKIGNRMPYSGRALGVRSDRENSGCLF